MNNVISGPEPICLTTRKSQMDLNQITSEKDLCIRFQDDLHFTKHLAERVKRANSMIGLIYRSFQYIETMRYFR